jgi:hypothetical protein
MTELCELLCVESRALVDDRCIDLVRSIMNLLHEQLQNCDRVTYVWVFTNVTALCMRLSEAFEKKRPLPGEHWAEFISNNLRTN